MEDDSGKNVAKVFEDVSRQSLGTMSDEDFKTLQELYIEVATLYYMVKNKHEPSLVKD
jgi:hypothetical protein